MPSSFPIFSATPEGVCVNGFPLEKTYLGTIATESRRYVERANRLLYKVTPEMWNHHRPHEPEDVSLLAKVQMLLALASPQPIHTLYKYRADQARVPAGNPHGGQWTKESEDNSETNVHSARSYQNTQQSLEAGINTSYGIITPVSTNIGPNGKGERQVNIFIGGAADQTDHHNVEASNSLKNAIGNNYYFPWDAQDKIYALIEALPEKTTINLVGHSWGGDAAARIALEHAGKPTFINTLITIDPVTTFGTKPNFDALAFSTRNWVNVSANPLDSVTTSGDRAAALFNGAWGDGANESATVAIRANQHHEYFNGMMQTPSATGKTPLQILNSSQ